jgi:hypothetical protein
MKLEGENDEHAFEAVGGETSIGLPSGKKAKPKTLRVALRGAIQAPVLNYSVNTDAQNNITGIEFGASEILAGDIIHMWWKNA